MDKAAIREQVGRCITHAGDAYIWGALSFSAIPEEVVLEDLGVEGYGYDMGVRLHVNRSDFPENLPTANENIVAADSTILRVIRPEPQHGQAKAAILCTESSGGAQ